tara:strand:+ start:87 stop:662 length:576 start_codon:yes stop_codon:yes gene_type:complete
MSFFTFLAIAGTGLQAYQQIQAGKAKQRMYENEATISALRTRGKVVDAKEKGVKVLRDLNRNVATLFTYKSIGGADPTSGSALTHALYSYRLGAEDFNIQALQADLDDKLGLIEYRNLQAAGKAAAKAGLNQAIMTLVTGTAKIGMSGGFDDLFSGSGNQVFTRTGGDFGSGGIYGTEPPGRIGTGKNVYG